MHNDHAFGWAVGAPSVDAVGRVLEPRLRAPLLRNLIGPSRQVAILLLRDVVVAVAVVVVLVSFVMAAAVAGGRCGSGSGGRVMAVMVSLVLGSLVMAVAAAVAVVVVALAMAMTIRVEFEECWCCGGWCWGEGMFWPAGHGPKTKV